MVSNSVSFEGPNEGMQVGVNYGNVTATFNTLSDDEIDQNCLRFLQCPDSQVVKNRLVEAKDKLHWESIEWVFKTPHYLSWMNETHLVILWIKGGAGKGKTMMSIGIIERLLLSIASRSNGKAPLIAYFFCQNADYRLNKLDSIIKGLIFQMIKQRPALIKCLRSHWDSKNNRFHGAMSWRKLWDIFLEMTERCQDATIYIVVDALDECQNDGISQFLRVIIRTSSLNAGKIKCLLTSRPLGDAEKELLTSKDQAQVSLELNSANVNQAIKSYITTKMEEIDRHQRLHPKLRQTVAQELVNRSDGTYLWVSLVCRDLKKTQPQEMLKRVQTLPEDLESLYKQKCAELSTGDSASMCMRMLKVVTLSFRPIHKDEFESVTGLSQKDWAIEALVARCGSFINMRGDFITFIHQSARDFLIGDNGASLLNMYEIYNHENIALRCVTFLATKLKVDLFNFVHPCSEPSRLAQLDDEQLSLFTRIRYAAQFWITHISKADSSFIQRSIGPDGLVCSFLEANILEWIEYLSWNDDILVAIEGLRTIKNINSELGTSASMSFQLAGDAIQILQRHFDTLAKWPLQLYSSIMIFTPDTSISKRKNLTKIPKWVCELPKIQEISSSLITSIEHHSRSISALGVSPDGTRIVSASWDGLLTLWESESRRVTKTFTCGKKFDHTSCISFSPDGRRFGIILREYGNLTGFHQVKVFDVVSNECLETMNVLHAATMTFSPHGTELIIACFDETLVTRDIQTKRETTQKQGRRKFFKSKIDLLRSSYDEYIFQDGVYISWRREDILGHQVAISPSGDYMTSSRRYKPSPLRVWTARGEAVETINSLNLDVLAVAISYDGSRMATTSTFDGVLIWSLKTGKIEKALYRAENKQDSVCDLFFSPDNKHLAAVGYSGAIYYFDMENGSHKGTLLGHKSKVGHLVFPRDSQNMISGSDDYTIKVWLTTMEDGKFLGSRLQPLHGVSISRENGKIVTIRSDDFGLVVSQLDDKVIGRITPRPDLHSLKFIKFDDIRIQCVTLKTLKQGPLALSPNRRLAAVHGAPGSIELWDISSGLDPYIIRGRPRRKWTKGITALAFSPDGEYLVAGYDSNLIKVWTTQGHLVKTLWGRTEHGKVEAIAVSADGKYLASSHDNTSGRISKCLAIWDFSKCVQKKKSSIFRRDSRTYSAREAIIDTGLRIARAIKFSSSDQFLLTEIGAYNFGDAILNNTGELNDLWVEDDWVHLGLDKILRLPSDLRGLSNDTWDDEIALTTVDNQVLSFRVDRSALKKALLDSSGNSEEQRS